MTSSRILSWVENRHKAINSLRAKATTIFLEDSLPASLVLCRYHFANSLFGWNLRKRQASWIIPCRTRALPARARPFSRRFFPLSSGDPVRPAYRATARRSRRLREKISPASISAVSMPRPRTRTNLRTIAAWLSSGARATCSARAVSISLDLVVEKPQPHHAATQFSQGIGRYGPSFRGAQIREQSNSLLQPWIEVPDAQARQS